jgi:hypothetical protein
MYGWDRTKFWSPFEHGLVGARSRLAVAAQVVLVTGDPSDGSAPQLYSINCSWGTMDRTWRYRALPASLVQYFDDATLARGDERIDLPPPAPGSQTRPDSVYPQTIRLRGDMTIHVKGTHGDDEGRWCQRYLPASNEPVPAAYELMSGRAPSRGYDHPWKFLTESAFARADRFSHFGVYADVDSRMKYYPVDVSAQDAASLDAVAAADPNAWWADSGKALFIWKYDFDMETLHVPYPATLPPRKVPMAPPSMYNPQALLRIVRRGARWIAMHWDKRDDDMLPLDGLPTTVGLATKDGAHRINVTLHPAVAVDGPPAVQTAYFWWEDANTAGLAISFPLVRSGTAADSVWRVRMAALDANGTVVTLADATFDQLAFNREAHVYVYRWTPASAAAAQLRSYATADGAARFATSIWFEDVTGHVAPPERTLWMRPGALRASADPAALPLGIPATFTVHAFDALSNATVVADVVFDDGAPPAKTEKSLTHTFNATVDRSDVGDPADRGHGPLKPVKPQREMPSMSVQLAGYAGAQVPVTFYDPRLTVRCDMGPVPANRPVQLLVQAQDDHTHAAVPAHVSAGGSTGTANAAFACTFAPGANTVRISFPGYPDQTLTVNAYVPALRLWCDPKPTAGRSQFVVHAVDATTGAPVAGRVKIGGVDAGATNATIAYTFRGRMVGPRLNQHMTYPAGEVVADGYPATTIDFGLSDDL